MFFSHRAERMPNIQILNQSSTSYQALYGTKNETLLYVRAKEIHFSLLAPYPPLDLR
jgi:hypothetical protein